LIQNQQSSKRNRYLSFLFGSGAVG